MNFEAWQAHQVYRTGRVPSHTRTVLFRALSHFVTASQGGVFQRFRPSKSLPSKHYIVSYNFSFLVGRLVYSITNIHSVVQSSFNVRYLFNKLVNLFFLFKEVYYTVLYRVKPISVSTIAGSQNFPEPILTGVQGAPDCVCIMSKFTLSTVTVLPTTGIYHASAYIMMMIDIHMPVGVALVIKRPFCYRECALAVTVRVRSGGSGLERIQGEKGDGLNAMQGTWTIWSDKNYLNLKAVKIGGNGSVGDANVPVELHNERTGAERWALSNKACLFLFLSSFLFSLSRFTSIFIFIPLGFETFKQSVHANQQNLRKEHYLK